MSKITKKAVLVFTICSALIVNASELDLSRTCIIRARRENPQQKAAADDLAKHLELITGTKPTEKKIADATAIFTFAHPHGEPKSKFTSFARREGNVIRFWGDDAVTRGKPQYGSAYAVAEFLERFLGVLWVDDAYRRHGVVRQDEAHGAASVSVPPFLRQVARQVSQGSSGVFRSGSVWTARTA